jgi:hypothetical protein
MKTLITSAPSLLIACLSLPLIGLFGFAMFAPTNGGAQGDEKQWFMDERPTTARTATRKKIAVLELFTSEGCHSCPPAEKLLNKTGREADAKAAGGNSDMEIVPLAFHVDYWNRLGWPDRFSSAAMTARQRGYAEQMRLRSLYTPQLVVNGTDEFVGSSSAKLEKSLGNVRAMSEPMDAALDVSMAGGKIAVRLSSDEPVPAGYQLMLAVTASGITTEVKHGENRGKTLTHDFVVIGFRKLDANKSVDVTPLLRKTSDAKTFHAVVLLQRDSHGPIAWAWREKLPTL